MLVFTEETLQEKKKGFRFNAFKGVFKNMKSTTCEMLAKDNGYQCVTIAPSTLIFPRFGKIKVFAVLCR